MISIKSHLFIPAFPALRPFPPSPLSTEYQIPLHLHSPMSTIRSTTIFTPQMQVCFSFAAYAKNVISHIKSLNIPVSPGLTDTEFTSLETIHNFTFPPDLRSILREGLPIGPSFPNWRSSSTQQLEILIKFPILVIRKEVQRGNFWCKSWGDEVESVEERVKLARSFWEKSPVLVPLYRNYYISSVPVQAGNPVFLIDGCNIKYSGFDVAGFFQQVELGEREREQEQEGEVLFRSTLRNQVQLPVWAAKSARRIEFWSDLVESGLSTCEEEKLACATGKWKEVLGDCFKKLRVGGWADVDITEMMTSSKAEAEVVLVDKESVDWHVRFLSVMLTRAGWSAVDVLESLGCHEDGCGVFSDVDSFLLDFQISAT